MEQDDFEAWRQIVGRKVELFKKSMGHFQVNPPIQNAYIRQHGEKKCHCAVGFVLKCAGLSDEELESLHLPDGTGLDILAVRDKRNEKPVYEKAVSLLEEHGFHKWDMYWLQTTNDNRAEHLLSYQNEVVAELAHIYDLEQ